MTDMRHMDFLDAVCNEDLAQLRHKERSYKGSWKKRGGIGAFMMMARKWDRLEGMAEEDSYDIFRMLKNGDGEDGSALAEVRDLRRYLLLVEAEHIAKGKRSIITPEDGNHHARAD